MEQDITKIKCNEMIQFVEETTGIDKLTQLEITPVPFADDNLYITGFRVDTYIPMIHIKHIKKLKLFGTDNSTQQQIEYYMMNPDADIWIDCTALDTQSLWFALAELKKQLSKTTSFDTLHVTYVELGKEIERHIAYTSKRIACKEAMNMRKIYNTLRFHFSKGNDNKISDLEFATAALE